jgi:hypothetical protein
MQSNWNKSYDNNNRYQGNPQYTQQYNTQPNPQRFATFQLIADESGFTLPYSNYVFYFDENGGWYDEFNNYYNADGQPDAPPRYNNNRRQDDRHGYDDDYDPADDFVNEYEQDEDGDEDDLGHYDNIYLNIENKKTLAKCLKDEEVEVEVRNLDYRSNEDQFEKFLVDKNIAWIEFEFEYDDRDRFRGICYMTVDKANAEKFIEFNGTKVLGRDIKVNVSRKKDAEGDESEHEEDIDVHAIGQTDEPIILKTEEQKTEDTTKEPTSAGAWGGKDITKKSNPSTPTLPK